MYPYSKFSDVGRFHFPTVRSRPRRELKFVAQGFAIAIVALVAGGALAILPHLLSSSPSDPCRTASGLTTACMVAPENSTTGGTTNLSGHQPPARYGAAAAYDPSHKEVVLFGGVTRYHKGTYYADTWTFRGGQWAAVNTTHAPSPRTGAAMAYDPLDGYTVLFGGCYSTALLGNCTSAYSDTWEYSDGNWTPIVTPNAPSARGYAAMTFDARDGYVLLFGGVNPNGFLGDTWTFLDGTWTQLHPAVAPVPRDDAGLAYDAADGYVLMAGGATNAAIEQTWTFQGGTWTELDPSVGPSAGNGLALAFDSADNCTVAFGGYAGALSAQTWTFRAGSWTAVATRPSPSARTLGAIVYDAADGYVLLSGGADPAAADDSWSFHAGAWTLVHRLSAPPGRDAAAMAYDAKDGYTVLFGGGSGMVYGWGGGVLGDTWTYVNGTWSQSWPASAPSPRMESVATYDAADGYVVLFGGRTGSGYLGDTWTYSGGAWTELTPAISPSARSNASMTYDSASGRILLFGGYDGSSYLGDTWTFAHGNWSKLSPVVAPPARAGAGLTFVPGSGGLLFGGFNGLELKDTWQFSAGAWTPVLGSFGLSARASPALVDDPYDGYALLYGGHDSALFDFGFLSDTWEFANGTWTAIHGQLPPPSPFAASIVVDAKDGYVLMFGGYNGYWIDESWKFSDGNWSQITTTGGVA